LECCPETREDIDDEVLSSWAITDSRVFAGQILGSNLFNIRVIPDRTESAPESFNILHVWPDEQVNAFRGTHNAMQVEGNAANQDVVHRVPLELAEKRQKSLEIHTLLSGEM
jgi:hypothetical protein